MHIHTVGEIKQLMYAKYELIFINGIIREREREELVILVRKTKGGERSESSYPILYPIYPREILYLQVAAATAKSCCRQSSRYLEC